MSCKVHPSEPLGTFSLDLAEDEKNSCFLYEKLFLKKANSGN